MEIAGLSWHCEPLTSVSQLESRWTELESRSDCSFFLTWDWIGNWLAETPNLSPLQVSVYDGSVAVGLALFQPRLFRGPFGQTPVLMLHQSGDSSADAITIEYNGVISDRRYTERVEAGLFGFLTQTGTFGPWIKVHIALAANAIADQARKSGLVVTERARMSSRFVNLNAVRNSGKSYLDFLSSNTRHQIRRSMRIYEQQGPLKATAASSVGEALAFLGELKSLHQKSWNNRGLPGSFANPYFERFHQALIRRCVERSAVEMVRVAAGDRLIGQVYNFIRNGRVYAYQTGLSYESESKLKPGLVSHLMCIDRHLKKGASAYDFLGGSARYKDTLGNKGPDLSHFVIERKTLRSQGFALARRLKNDLLN